MTRINDGKQTFRRKLTNFKSAFWHFKLNYIRVLHKTRKESVVTAHRNVITFNISMDNHITVQIVNSFQNLPRIFTSHILRECSV